DKEGQKRTSFEIVANNFRMLGGRAEGAMSASAGAGAGPGADAESQVVPGDEHPSGGAEVTDEDIPF
ncbi:MAG TPA: single-stranded DNA-binding protein, partial [Methylomirabilota bacterium]|nr:single-stranded DNA-binding protein [Methylomirabilota bacterium]